MSFWVDQRVLVTGGGGFLGSFVVEGIRRRGCTTLNIPRRKVHDLRDAATIEKLLQSFKPTLIIHLAASCGGIGINQTKPGEFFYDNAIMGIQLMEYARRYNVSKFVQIGTVCAYPKVTPVPFHENDLWNGYPEETNAPYGLAKKMLLVQAQAYRQQYGFNAIYVLPANLYGPRDNFDLETSHVIPALIRKFVEAKAKGHDCVTLWGTGAASRDFFYVEDASEGILQAAERYNDSEPINLGTAKEISILEVAAKVQTFTGFKGHIAWDTQRPDGQPRRSVSAQRAQELFGFKAPTSIDEGLKRTIEWYTRSLVSA